MMWRADTLGQTLRRGGATLLLGVVLYLAAWSNQGPQFSVIQPCDLGRGGCLARSPTGEGVELALAPAGIPLLEPLEVAVTLHRVKASDLQVVFSGIDIDMGRLAYPLASEDGQHYRTTVTLSVCSRRKMRWRAEVMMMIEGRRQVVPFQFEAEYQPRFNLL